MGSALLDTTPLDPACFDAAGHSHAAAPALAPAPHEALRLQVSQRLAAHRDRRDRLHPQPSAEAKPIPSDTRATRIAAAVAERFAHSPSYRAFLAAEAERATQQAQAAAEVAALNAQAVAQAQQQLLESLYPVIPNDQAIADDPIPEPTLWLEPDPTPTTNPGGPSFPVLSERVGYRAEARPSSATNATCSKSAKRPNPPAPAIASGLTVRIFEDTPLLSHPPAPHPRYAVPNRDDEAESRALDEEITFRHAPVFEEPAGPPMPLPANLIEFPRQLVAPRKARPRFAEGPLREDDSPSPGNSQLRIFEVEASQISTTPCLAEPPAPQWTSIWLDAPGPASRPAPAEATAEPSAPEGVVERLEPDTWESSHHAKSPNPYTTPNPRPQTAPIPRRLMAAAIDGCLILAGFLAFAATFTLVSLRTTVNPPGERLHLLLARTGAVLADHAGLQPGPALAAIAAAFAFLYLLYQTLFFSLSSATPGMRCARIALCTFADENPTRPAMLRRSLAVLLSACSLGLGFLWAALDEDRLTWHDLISRMYQRSY